MAKFSLTFLLLVAVVCVVTGQANDQCGRNQQFTQCGTACPNRCNEDTSVKICTAQCVIGCQCKPGYLLNGRGECVPPSEC